MAAKYKNINKIGIATIAGTIGVELVNFILIPIMTRALGTSGYGTISIYSAWSSVIIAVCGLQTTQSIVYIIAEKKEKVQKDYFASMLVCSTICFVLCGLLFAAIGSVFGGILGFPTFLVVIMFLQAFGNYSVNYAGTIFTQQQKPIKQIILSVSVAISTALLTIGLVMWIGSAEEKYIGRILGYAIPYFLIGFGLACKSIGPNLKKIRFSYIKEYLPLCLPIIVHALASNVFSQSDRVMLGYIVDSSAAGIYSFAYSIAALLSVAWVTLNSFYQPFFFAYMKNDDIEMVEEKTKNLIELYTCGYAAFLFVIPEMMTVFGGKDFSSATQYLPVLALGVYFNFLYVFNSNYEIYYKKTSNIAVATTITAIVNITLNGLLIPRYSIMGAAVATLISCAALFLLHLLFALRISKGKNVQYVFQKRFFAVGGMAAIGATILSYFLKPYFIVRLIAGIVLAVYILRNMIKRRSII